MIEIPILSQIIIYICAAFIFLTMIMGGFNRPWTLNELLLGIVVSAVWPLSMMVAIILLITCKHKGEKE
jgi:hypothetical protein